MSEAIDFSNNSSEPPKTPAERIKELSAINTQIPQILRAASTAISSLTNSYKPSEEDASNSDTVQNRRRIFESNTRTFFTQTMDISSLLLSQADALEAAYIIPARPPKPGRDLTAAEQSAALSGGGSGSPPGAQMPGQQAPAVRDPESSVTNSGLGGLDIGWLNSRSGRGDVGVGMETEILGKVRERLEELVGNDATPEVNEDEVMEEA